MISFNGTFDFLSQRHDSIGWVKSSPNMPSDRPETFVKLLQNIKKKIFDGIFYCVQSSIAENWVQL